MAGDYPNGGIIPQVLGDKGTKMDENKYIDIKAQKSEKSEAFIGVENTNRKYDIFHLQFYCHVTN